MRPLPFALAITAAVVAAVLAESIVKKEEEHEIEKRSLGGRSSPETGLIGRRTGYGNTGTHYRYQWRTNSRWGVGHSGGSSSRGYYGGRSRGRHSGGRSRRGRYYGGRSHGSRHSGGRSRGHRHSGGRSRRGRYSGGRSRRGRYSGGRSRGGRSSGGSSSDSDEYGLTGGYVSGSRTNSCRCPFQATNGQTNRRGSIGGLGMTQQRAPSQGTAYQQRWYQAFANHPCCAGHQGTIVSYQRTRLYGH